MILIIMTFKYHDNYDDITEILPISTYKASGAHKLLRACMSTYVYCILWQVDKHFLSHDLITLLLLNRSISKFLVRVWLVCA